MRGIFSRACPWAPERLWTWYSAVDRDLAALGGYGYGYGYGARFWVKLSGVRFSSNSLL